MYLTVILTFILDLLKIFFVNGFDEEMKEGGDTDEAGHGVHGVVVEERRGVQGAGGHDRH